MTREERSIAGIPGNNVARLDQHDIAHDNVRYVDQMFSAITEGLDKTVFSLLVQSLRVEQFLFLPVVYGSDTDDDKDSNKDSDAFDPINRDSGDAIQRESCQSPGRGPVRVICKGGKGNLGSVFCGETRMKLSKKCLHTMRPLQHIRVR